MSLRVANRLVLYSVTVHNLNVLRLINVVGPIRWPVAIFGNGGDLF